MSVVIDGEPTDVAAHRAPEVDEAFIRKALNGANINALRLSIYMLTGDEELLKLRVVPKLVRGGALIQSVVHDDDAQIVKDKALEWLLHGRHGKAVPAPPAKAEVRKLMETYTGRPVEDEHFEMDYEELALDHFPREAKWPSKQPAASVRDSYHVLLIGAGITAIAVAIQLKRLGIPFTIIEKLDALGGTWYVNQYPDCRVDTPSHLFSFKSEKNYAFSEYFCSSTETLRYLQYCVDKYDLADHFIFNVESKQAVWQEENSKWKVELHYKDGRKEFMETNFVVSCSGSLSNPKLPDIPGVKDFKGRIFHTQQWDHTAPIKDARVAVIGNGSTGVQLTPVIATEAKKITIYQRTPQWITNMDGYRTLITDDVRWVFNNVPYYWNWQCYSVHVASLQLHGLQKIDREWQKKGGYISERNDKIREGLTNYIKSKVGSRPDIYEKVLPDYAPLVRRLIVDNGWYDCLLRDNVELVAEGVQRITEKGIVTSDGEREFDTIVLAMGFDLNNFFYPMKYYGREKHEIHEAWEKDGPRSYLGLTHLHMPNFLSTLGPNHAPSAGGLYSWAELWARYVGDIIAYTIANGKKSFEIKPDVYDKYQTRLDAQLKDKIWGEKGAGYYVHPVHNRPNINNPFTMWEASNNCRKVNIDDYKWT